MRRATVLLVALAMYAVAATGAAILLGHASSRESSRRNQVEKQLAVTRSAQLRARAAAASLRTQNDRLRNRVYKLQADARLAAEAAAFSRRGAGSVSILASPGGTIEWFAQSGARIAWVRSRRSKPFPGNSDVCWKAEHTFSESPLPLRVSVRDLSTGKASVATLGAAPCQHSSFAEPVLAFGGTHVVAEFIAGLGNTEILASVEAASVRGGKPWGATTQALVKSGPEQRVMLLAAASGSVLAAYFQCEISDECAGAPQGSGVAKIRPYDDVNASWGLRKLFGVSGAPELLTVGDGTVALATHREILISSARGGRLNARVPTSGANRALATSDRILAVLTNRGGVDWIDLYDAQTGALRGKVDVGRAGEGLAVSGFHVVFSSGRFIRTLDARTRRTSVIAVAAATPIGLSIDGRQVAWAENGSGGARISSVPLPD